MAGSLSKSPKDLGEVATYLATGPLRSQEGKSSPNSTRNGDNSLDFTAASNSDVGALRGASHERRDCGKWSELEEYGGFVGPKRAIQKADANQSPVQVRNQSAKPGPDEAILAIARALATRHAREDHAAELARTTQQIPAHRIT